MKKFITILAVTATLLLTLGSCSMHDINGDLDGQWQVVSIVTADGTELPCTDFYFRVQQHIVQLVPDGGGPRDHIGTGVLDYDRGDKEMTVTFPYAKDGNLSMWGIPGNSVTYNITKLSHQNCTLVSADATLTMRKW